MVGTGGNLAEGEERGGNAASRARYEVLVERGGDFMFWLVSRESAARSPPAAEK